MTIRAQAIRFENVSDRANMVASGPGKGIAIHDYDRDGFDDVFVTQSLYARSSLFRNNGDGTFSDVTEAAGIRVDGRYRASVWADFDNDGHGDLYVGGVDYPNVLYRNNGDGTFTDVTATSGIDPNSDTGSLAVADFDGDGFVDLFDAVDRAPDRLYRNLAGSMAFEDVTLEAGVAGRSGSVAMQAAWNDVNHDGSPDLLAVHDGSDANRFYVNTGTLPFPERAAMMGLGDTGLGNAMGLAWGDFDGDAWEDVYVSRLEMAGLFRNLGNGSFEPVPQAAGAQRNGMAWGTLFGDFDNDGDQDLFVANSHGWAGLTVPNQLFENRDGQFTDVAPSAGIDMKVQATGAASADFDRDGQLDIVFTASDGQVRLFRGDSPSPGNWLRVRLTGNRVNRMAIGARVEVDAGGRTMVRSLAAGDSYCSQSSSTLHFGLGSAATVDRVRVFWGSGDVDERLLVAANSEVDIVQTSTSTTAIQSSEPGTPPKLEVYPVPFSDVLAIRSRLPGTGAVRVEIMDLIGRTMQVRVDDRPAAGVQEFRLMTAGWPPGFYVVRLTRDGRQYVRPVIRH